MATADDFGQVNLFKYPSYIEKSQCKSYLAHSSHVTKVKFLGDDSKLISTGGNDKTIFVWDTDFGGGHVPQVKDQEDDEGYGNDRQDKKSYGGATFQDSEDDYSEEELSQEEVDPKLRDFTLIISKLLFQLSQL